MRLIYISGLLILFLFGCSKSEGPSTIDEAGNETEDNNLPPEATSLVFPTNNLICTGLDLEFEWQSVTDPEGDTVTYEIEIATDNQFSAIVHSNKTVETSRIHDLENATTYYWRVRAVDTLENASPYSPTWDFYTEREAAVNLLPSLPSLVQPALGATVSQGTIELHWDASDADGDSLVYDIYFGDTNEPEIQTENTTSKTLLVNTVAGKTYYWKIAVKDGRGGISYGPLWNFNAD